MKLADLLSSTLRQKRPQNVAGRPETNQRTNESIQPSNADRDQRHLSTPLLLGRGSILLSNSSTCSDCGKQIPDSAPFSIHCATGAARGCRRPRFSASIRLTYDKQKC